MPDAVSISVRELPTRYFSHPAIAARIKDRGGESEVVFRYRGEPSPPLLPIIYHDEFRIVRWGNGQRRSRMLPAVGVVNISDMHKPVWKRLVAQDVVIQAQALLHSGVWISVVDGIRGVYASDEHGTPTVYMMMEPSTDYYQIMTKSWVMPKMVGEVI